MTTNVKASKFRMRRAPRPSEDAASPTPEQPGPAEQTPTLDAAPFETGEQDDGLGSTPYPGAGSTDTGASPRARRRGVAGMLGQNTGISDAVTETVEDEVSVEEQIEAIRREGLTGRQLRMARRVAKKHGIEADNDFDAVRQLRDQGLDPFKKDAPGALVTTEDVPGKDITPVAVNMPQNEFFDRIAREQAVSQIQKDIAKRRKRKFALMIARLIVFIGVPTFLTGYYFYQIATPMYETHSEFVIQQAEAPSASAGGLGGLLGGSPLATSQDSITVQSYLQSRDAMLRLNDDIGFKTYFSDPMIDPIQRLEDGASNEAAYKLYKKHVKISYDMTEGILKMDVVAPDPMLSQSYNQALIAYAEERVDGITQRLREDQMSGARESLADAEAKMVVAQQRIVDLQEQRGIISPEAETSAIMARIASFETQIEERRIQLQALLDNPRPNEARVDGARADIRRLEDSVVSLRDQMTQAQGAAGSLARIAAEQSMAEVELQTRQMMVQQAVQSMEAARIEANRQTRYLSLGVSPVAPDEPTYPRQFENTALAFLVFSGLYLMASLTAAVLREQVSA